MMQVKKGTRYWLHWPPDVANPIEPRGGPGTVVDDEHPLEAVRNEDGEVVGGFLRGQMHKLEPVSKKRKPTPIDHPVARGLYREYENEQQRGSIIRNHGQIVGRRPVRAHQDQIVQFGIGEGDISQHQIPKTGLSSIGRAETNHKGFIIRPVLARAATAIIPGLSSL